LSAFHLMNSNKATLSLLKLLKVKKAQRQPKYLEHKRLNENPPASAGGFLFLNFSMSEFVDHSCIQYKITGGARVLADHIPIGHHADQAF